MAATVALEDVDMAPWGVRNSWEAELTNTQGAALKELYSERDGMSLLTANRERNVRGGLMTQGYLTYPPLKSRTEPASTSKKRTKRRGQRERTVWRKDGEAREETRRGSLH